MKTLDGQERFNERRRKCSPTIREVLRFLMKAAANAGPDVISPPTPELKGEGVKYRSGSGQFCVLHPKHEKHVWARVHHADRDALTAALTKAGLLFTREDTDGPWIQVANMQDAVRLVSFVVGAYDERSATRR